DIFFRKFGSVGATIVFFTLYLISMVYLTNFHLGVWVRSFWSREPMEKDDKDWTPEEKALARKARELEKQARKLQEQTEKSGSAPAATPGLGADLKPVPAPTVRDLSVPASRPAPKTAKSKPAPEPEPI